MSKLHSTVRVHGARWRYVIVPEADPILDGAEAMTRRDEAVVYISDAVSAERVLSIVAHEDIHVALAELTDADKAALFGCDPDGVEDAEERIASTLGPLLAQIQNSRRRVRVKA